ncbi:MAG: site-2 protease family protein [Anaerolineales bacterium]|nr:site-2 protease family protein [Anaerolineales bacterium]
MLTPLIARLRRLTPIQWVIVALLLWFVLTEIYYLIRQPSLLLARLLILGIAFPVHEFAHAWAAVSLGDETPRLQGRLTLNPLKHLDVFGTILLLINGFGWAKPVQVFPWYLRGKYGMVWVALAGPVSNLILAVLGAVGFRLGAVQLTGASFFGQMIAQFIFINLILFFFNLIPLFPLDGEKIAYHLAPLDWQRQFDRIRPYSIFILIMVAFALPQVFSFLIIGPSQFLLNLLIG